MVLSAALSAYIRAPTTQGKLREVRPVSERNSHLCGACGITPCRDRVHFSGKTVLGLPPSRPSSQKIGETCTDGVEIGANLPGNQTICT